LRQNIDRKLAPKYGKPTVDDKEVQERLDKLLETTAHLKK